jgi:ADP-ribose pyrophosphatase YjhB (NUDIX family)
MAQSKNNIREETGNMVKDFLETASGIFMPGVSLNTVIFSFHKDKLKVLLLRLSDTPHFMLPGGYIKKEEDLDAAALRSLQETTGLENIFLEQFYTSGNAHRYDEKILQNELKKITGSLPADSWLEQRFVSVCYYALVDETNVNPTPALFSTELKWFNVKNLPKLLFDHNLIIKKALGRLQSDLDQKLVGFNLLNETFTMSELQKLYEAVYQKKLVRTNFQRKMLGLSILERLEKKYSGKAHKAPYLYRFRDAK